MMRIDRKHLETKKYSWRQKEPGKSENPEGFQKTI